MCDPSRLNTKDNVTTFVSVYVYIFLMFEKWVFLGDKDNIYFVYVVLQLDNMNTFDNVDLEYH